MCRSRGGLRQPVGKKYIVDDVVDAVIFVDIVVDVIA